MIEETFYVKKYPDIQRKEFDFTSLLKNRVLCDDVFEDFFQMYPEVERHEIIENIDLLRMVKNLFYQKAHDLKLDIKYDYRSLEYFYLVTKLNVENVCYQMGIVPYYDALFEEVSYKNINPDVINENYYSLKDFACNSEYIGKKIKVKDKIAKNDDSILLFLGKYVSLAYGKTVRDYNRIHLLSNFYLENCEVYGLSTKIFNDMDFIESEISNDFVKCKKKTIQ